MESTLILWVQVLNSSVCVRNTALHFCFAYWQIGLNWQRPSQSLTIFCFCKSHIITDRQGSLQGSSVNKASNTHHSCDSNEIIKTANIVNNHDCVQFRCMFFADTTLRKRLSVVNEARGINPKMRPGKHALQLHWRNPWMPIIIWTSLSVVVLHKVHCV